MGDIEKYICTFFIFKLNDLCIFFKNENLFILKTKSVHGSCVLNKWPNWETLLNLDFQTIALINICSKTTFLNLRLYLQKEVLDGVKTIEENVRNNEDIFCFFRDWDIYCSGPIVIGGLDMNHSKHIGRWLMLIHKYSSDINMFIKQQPRYDITPYDQTTPWPAWVISCYRIHSLD